MPDPRDLSDSQERVTAAGLLLSGMQFAVFERLPSGAYIRINAYPIWLRQLFPDHAATDPAASLTDHFPALEGFLPLAEDFWQAPSTERLQSDFWTETDTEGTEYHLVAYAIAVTSAAREFLVIERADATYIDHQQLQLYAHEMVIQYDTISRLNREVEAATRAKSDFLATMSHEIRTPLNAILGMADLLADTSLNPQQKGYVEVFQRAGANLLGLINDILDMSKVEAGHLELESVDFDLADVIHGVLELTRVKAAVKGLEVGSTLASTVPPMLIGDPTRLRQIILNLLGNAMKFTDKGSLDVEVAQDPADATPGSLLFRVKDTGIGIPQDKLSSIFENFSQADSSTTRKYGGTGLGLAISKRLVELMHGRIWVESTVGEGSTFLFTAKFAISQQAPTPGTHSPTTTPQSSGVALSPGPWALSPQLHVLLADDSEDNRFLIREYLRNTPCVLDLAENGEIALGKMKCCHYDLVLMDAHMPVMDGYTATRAIRAWERAQSAPPLPILALTADAFREAVEASALAGFTAHLTKPIAKSTLIAAIRQHALVCTQRAAIPAQPAVPAQPADLVEPLAVAEPSVSSLAPRYLKNMEKELKSLRQAEAAEDFAVIQRIGHNLHGTGGSFGFPRITDLGTVMEQAAKDHTMEPIHASIDDLETYLQQVTSSHPN